jgi:hypothetical protein
MENRETAEETIAWMKQQSTEYLLDLFNTLRDSDKLASHLPSEIAKAKVLGDLAMELNNRKMGTYI